MSGRHSSPGPQKRIREVRDARRGLPDHDDRELDAVLAYYALGGEQARLGAGLGLVEWERSREILLRYLPAAPAVVADIGGGPGRYARWLAELGYQVHHRDLVPLHVQQLEGAGEKPARISSRVADARRLDLADESVDAVLLLGPLYHLQRRSDRLQALREARRIVRPGGILFVAAISRWAPRLHGVLVSRLYEHYLDLLDETDAGERTGYFAPLFPGSFSAYAHRPQQLRSEIRAAGCQMLDLVSVEGLAFALPDLQERMADPKAREVVLEAARAVERAPELLGLGPHLLATARRPSLAETSPPGVTEG